MTRQDRLHIRLGSALYDLVMFSTGAPQETVLSSCSPCKPQNFFVTLGHATCRNALITPQWLDEVGKWHEEQYRALLDNFVESWRNCLLLDANKRQRTAIELVDQDVDVVEGYLDIHVSNRLNQYRGCMPKRYKQALFSIGRDDFSMCTAKCWRFSISLLWWVYCTLLRSTWGAA